MFEGRRSLQQGEVIQYPTKFMVDLSLILVLEVDSTTSTTFSTNSDVDFNIVGPSSAPQAQVSCFIQTLFAPHS